VRLFLSAPPVRYRAAPGPGHLSMRRSRLRSRGGVRGAHRRQHRTQPG